MTDDSDSSDSIEGVVLDTTVLSNYAASDSVGFLTATFAHPLSVAAVKEELERGSKQGRPYLEEALRYLTGSGQTETIPVGSVQDRSIQQIQKLDYGERHALAYARDHGWALATDDMEARSAAETVDVPCTGSLGILIRGIENEEISVAEAESWHTT
ncbi:hypothetical protein [Natrinema ejinorense]|uniref:PIN domain-containing protein n=1 Tax=Natrinema ejinorense TaxID=373386 RepID=A0A2A5R078_9EURY|nr:hypothetical protein [Natrinema ejinorense]PCR92462.1 hypothetical protein CP557_19155 [Natrinema ejinorense]